MKKNQRKPELPLQYYQSFDKDGDLVGLDQLTRQELQNELACCYDIIQKFQDAGEHLRELIKLADDADEFMTQKDPYEIPF